MKHFVSKVETLCFIKICRYETPINQIIKLKTNRKQIKNIENMNSL